MQATVKKLAAELEQSSRDHDRMLVLRKTNAASEAEYENSFFQTQSLQGALEAAKARLSELESGTRDEDIDAQKNRLLELDAQIAVLETRIQKADLFAPFDADVIGRVSDEGAVVRQGSTVLTISEAGRYEACFSVPITQVGNARKAKSVLVSGRRVEVQAVRAIRSVSARTRTVKIVYSLDATPGIFNGQSCTLHLEQHFEMECIELPISALIPSVRGLWSVYLLANVGDPNEFEIVRHDLTISHSDGDTVIVESSIPGSSLVVADGVHKLVPGMRVRLRRGKE